MKALLRKVGVADGAGLRKVIWQFIKFGAVGAVNTVLSLLIYYIFIWIDPALYLWGNVVGWVVTVFNAFFWNNKYVFRQEKAGWGPWLRRLGRTYLSYGVSFALGTGLLWAQVRLLGIPEAVAPILNLLVTIPVNFLMNKFWAFKD